MKPVRLATIVGCLLARATPVAIADVTSDDAWRDVLLRFDDARPAEAVAAMDKIALIDPTAMPTAAVIAWLYGQDSAVARYLDDHPDPALGTLAGEASLRAGQPAAARGRFESALPRLKSTADRRYTIERITAAARAEKALPMLADQWLSAADLPAEFVPALVAVARETNRVPALLAWWARQPTTVTAEPTTTRGVLAAALAENLTDEALAVSGRMLASHAEDVEWLRATAATLLDAGRAAEADRLLVGHLGVPQVSHVAAVARLAAALGRDDTALRAATTLSEFGPSAAVDADLLAAGVYHRRGDKASASRVLRDAAGRTRTMPDRVGDVAASLEAVDLPDESARLLAGAVQDGGGDELSLRLANLFAQQKRFAEAVPLLDGLRRRAAMPAVREQAARQLLAAAESAGTLAELVRRVEQAGPADVADVSLLVDAYRVLKRPDAAEQLLTTTPLLNEPERLSRLGVLHQREKAFDKADAVLRRLVDVDPARAIDAWRQIAAVAAVRKRDVDIESAVAALRRLLPPGPASDETLGGLLSQLGRPAEAASAYASALLARPDSTDDWLLWAAAMNASGQRSAAIERLARLAHDATRMAVFAAAADGLLNLNAPADVLRAVRREAMLRLARSPRETLGYAVTAELCEELKDTAVGGRVGELSVVLGDQTRPQALRDLMESAIGSYRTDIAIAAGRTLLATGDDFPPQLFLDLGEQLLLAGRDGEAGNAFSRAIESAEDNVMVPKVAALLARYGHPERARRQLAALSRRRPYDANVLALLSVQDQVCGDRTAAFEHSLAALDGQLRELPSVQATTGDPREAGLIPNALPYVTTLNGAIENATTPARQEQLLSMLRDRFAAAIADQSRVKEAITLSHALRRAAFVLGRVDLADDTDDELIRRRPSPGFADTVLTERWNYGLYGNVRVFAQRHALNDRLPPLLRSVPTTLPTTGPELSSDALAWLPQAAWQGDHERVRALLDATAGPTDDPSRVMPARIAAAGAIGDLPRVRRLSIEWLEQAARTKPAARAGRRGRPVLGQFDLRFYKPPSPPEQWWQALATGWNVLDVAGRAELGRRAVELARASKDPSNLTPALRIAAAAGVDPEDAAELILRATTRPGGEQDLPPLLRAVTPSVAAELLPRAVARLDPPLRLHTLRVCAAQTDDAAIAAALVRCLDDVAGPQQSGDRPVAPSTRAEVRRAVGRALVRTGGDDASTLVDAATELCACGDAAAADIVAARALAAIANERPPLPAEAGGNDDPATPIESAARARWERTARAIAAMSPAGVRASLSEPPAGPDDWRAVCQAGLLAAAGDRATALVALREAMGRFGDRTVVRVAVLERLREDGRSSEIIQRFLPSVASSGPQTRAAVVEALADARRTTEAWHLRNVGGTTEPMPDLITVAEAGDDAVARAVRSLLIRLRDNDDPPTLRPLLPPARGLADRKPVDRAVAFTVDILGRPKAFEALASTLPLIPPGAVPSEAGLDWAARMLARVTDSPERKAELLRGVDARARSGALMPGDRALLQALAVAGVAIESSALVDAMRDATLVDPSTDRVRSLAATLRTSDPAASANATTWADWSERVDGSRARTGAEPAPPRPPSPLTDALDAGTSEWIGRALTADPRRAVAIERDLSSIPGSLPDPIWVRLAAERGDMDVFGSRLASWLEHGVTTSGGSPDLRDAFPVTCADAAVRDRLLARATTVLREQHTMKPTRTGWVYAVASLGMWAHEQDARESANALADMAAEWSVRLGPCRSQAASADLLDATGHGSGDDIRKRLSTAGCLP